MMNLRNALVDILEGTSLRNTIAYILEHDQLLAKSNEAATQQYVVLPILRALGWDDAKLDPMEILPEHNVGEGDVDYALKVGQKPALFIECKRWNESLEKQKHEDQIFKYAFNGGVPIAVLTNGKTWRFYRAWAEGVSPGDRLFCETDIEDLDKAVSNLEIYLLKSNVMSGKARDSARTALKEMEELRQAPANRQNPISKGTKQDSGKPLEEETETQPQPRRAKLDYFCIPILQTLEEFGGSAATTKVFEAPVIKEAAGKMQEDHGTQKDWRQDCRNARKNLRDDGYLRGDSKKGIWEITDKGRDHLKQHGG